MIRDQTVNCDFWWVDLSPLHYGITSYHALLVMIIQCVTYKEEIKKLIVCFGGWTSLLCSVRGKKCHWGIEHWTSPRENINKGKVHTINYQTNNQPTKKRKEKN